MNEFKEVTIKEKKLTLPNFTESYEEICKELKSISMKLRDLLPDPSIGPEERIERLGRVVPGSLLISAHHKTARSKLNYIRNRLNELMPGPKNQSLEDKVDVLIRQLHTLVPEEEKRIFIKLEKIGDNRSSDIGR